MNTAPNKLFSILHSVSSPRRTYMERKPTALTSIILEPNLPFFHSARGKTLFNEHKPSRHDKLCNLQQTLGSEPPRCHKWSAAATQHKHRWKKENLHLTDMINGNARLFLDLFVFVQEWINKIFADRDTRNIGEKRANLTLSEHISTMLYHFCSKR